MKRKAADKLFYLVYTDAMTGAYNRNAYEEHIKKLSRKNTQLDNITVIMIKLDDLNEIKYTMGSRSADETVRLTASCIMQTVGEKAYVYRLSEDEFICISGSNVLPYIAELHDLISFESRDKKMLLNVLIGYMRFDNKKHKNISELIKDCDRQLMKARRRTKI